MKVLLIFPRRTEGQEFFSSNSFISHAFKPLFGLGKSNAFPPLSLLMIAAATPHDHEVRIIDERFEEIDFDEKVDLVGITVVTEVAPRAYGIAEEFRKRGIPAVLGGIHPSVLPREACLHANSVVIGEGEGVWPRLLEDLKNGRLQQFYTGKRQSDPNDLPWPRRELIARPDRYVLNKVVMATRGCENSCAFCSNGLAIGKRYRKRNIRNVIDEIESIPGKIVLFVDDNLAWDIDHAKRLFRALIPLKIKWFGQLTVSSLEDLELVDLMAESGCVTVGLGFESTSARVIAAIKKDRTNDPSRYMELIKRVHRRDISIMGYFIVGFDEDGKNVFTELGDFIDDSCIETPIVNILIPYPGTIIYRQFDRQGRLFHKDWSLYDTTPYVVYQPRQMTPEELIQGFASVVQRVNRPLSFVQRAIQAGTFLSAKTLLGLQNNIQILTEVRAGLPKAERALQQLPSRPQRAQIADSGIRAAQPLAADRLRR